MTFKASNIFSSPLVKNTLKLSSSNVLMYLLPLVVTPILTRLYAPEAFGDWGVFSSVLIIANIGVFLGYENAIVKAKTHNDAITISAACAIISFLIITVIYILFIALAAIGIDFFVSFPNIHLLATCLYSSALFNIFSNLSNRFEKYSVMSISSIVLGGSQALFRILFGSVILVAVNGLILGTAVAQIINALFFLVCLYSVLKKQNWRSITLDSIKQQLIINKRFPLYDAPASILSFAAFNLPIIILSLFFSKAEIGCYSVIIQLLLMPMSFVGSAMGRVYYRQISESDNNASIADITRKVLKITSVIAILPMLFLACGGDKLVVLFLGAKWTNAGYLALCLSPWSFLTVLTQPLMPLLRAKDRQSDLLKYNFLYFAIGILSIIVMSMATSNLMLVILIYSLGCSFAKFMLFKSILYNANVQISCLNKSIIYLWISVALLLILRLIIIFCDL